MAKRRSIGIGLIGIGRHGIRYARHIIGDVPDAALVAVCRRHPEKPLDIPGSESVRLYGDPRRLIDDPSVDVVVVVMPPVLNREIGLRAVQAGKPVLIEKPLAAFHADAQALEEAADKATVPLMTAQTLRFDPVITALKEKWGSIGRVRELLLTSHLDTQSREADHAEGYGKRGAVLEFGVHMFDLVRFVTHDEIKETRCTLNVLPAIAPESSASVRLVTQAGIRVDIDIARVPAGRVGRARVVGSTGVLTADWIQRRLELNDGGDQLREWSVQPIPTVVATLRAFLEAVANRQPMPVTGRDGCRAVEIAEACYRSAELGGQLVNVESDY